ncbi:hypothetical protein L3X38_008453 [Prunus dulcis]|uniref:Uncharacterized protein n=1 Tax=Prunus dulcis TaxID=3755 RepID=A0AAD4ZWT1_PRUDU|nr:hypothetical protein L3X38_008453 [Prunus dulcis]
MRSLTSVKVCFLAYCLTLLYVSSPNWVAFASNTEAKALLKWKASLFQNKTLNILNWRYPPSHNATNSSTNPKENIVTCTWTSVSCNTAGSVNKINLSTCGIQAIGLAFSEYAFLVGLDDIFDKVRSDILRTQSLPSVEEVFSVVRREAQRHATMMSGSNNQGRLPSMTMVFRPAAAFRPRYLIGSHKKKLRANERGSGGNNGGRASLATTPPKTKEDETISNNPSQTLLTHSTHGDSSSTAGSDTEHHAGWILDSGTTDHMTYDKNVFQYMTTSHREYIATANGTRAPVVGAGGDVTVEQRVEPRTKPILGESRQAIIEKNPIVEQPCAEPSIPLIVEPSMPSLSSSEVPPNTSSLNMPEVSIVNDCVTNPSIGCKLPPRQNRDVPPDRFSPEGKVKYPIANYVSCNKLASERQTLVSNMESIHVPTRVEKALKDPKWAKAMDEEMLALQKNNTWEEEVYIDFPPGYSNDGNTGVCRLRNDVDEMSKLQGNLSVKFEMKDLGDLKYFLGVKVARLPKGIFLSQHKYVLDLLKETGMLGCKPVETLIVEKHHLCLDPEQKLVDKGRYQRLVGRLIYLAHTRPDIAYAVSVVSQFMHSPSVDHMAVVMRILVYLKFAPGKGVLYRKNGHLRIEGFTDVDWAGDVTDRRSTSGYFTFVGGNLVTWRSKKQKVVSRSSAEAEYRGMAQGICEILWLRKLLCGLGFKPKDTMKLFSDNKSARDIADNPVQHDRTKYVEVDRHSIKEKLEKKIVSIPFVESEGQLADVLTHAVCSRKFDSISSSSALPAHQMPMEDILDQRISPPTHQEAGEVVSVVKIAFACLNPSLQSRPTMKQVSQCLSTQMLLLSEPLHMITCAELLALNDFAT